MAPNFGQNMHETNGNGKIEFTCNFYRKKILLKSNLDLDLSREL